MPPLSRRALGPVAAWVAAAVVAVALASWGVDLVGRSVTDRRPAPLSAAQVEERLASTTVPASTAATSSTTGVADPLVPVEVAGPDTTGVALPPAATTPLAGAPAATTTPPTAPPGGAAPPANAPPVGETRTYALVGGTASLRFEPGGVSVVFANPAAGFEVEVEPEHGGVKVEFESDGHRSRVVGWWDGGPRDQVEERADDD